MNVPNNIKFPTQYGVFDRIGGKSHCRKNRQTDHGKFTSVPLVCQSCKMVNTIAAHYRYDYGERLCGCEKLHCVRNCILQFGPPCACRLMKFENYPLQMFRSVFRNVIDSFMMYFGIKLLFFFIMNEI